MSYRYGVALFLYLEQIYIGVYNKETATGRDIRWEWCS